jgi:fatty acid desaturase
LIKSDLPAPSPSIWSCYTEMLPIWLRQLRGEDVFLLRELPPGAKPYQPDAHVAEAAAAA